MSALQNDDLGHPQAASLRHGEDGATSATCFFSAQFEERLSPAPLKIKSPTGHFAAKCRLLPPHFFATARHLN